MIMKKMNLVIHLNHKKMMNIMMKKKVSYKLIKTHKREQTNDNNINMKYEMCISGKIDTHSSQIDDEDMNDMNDIGVSSIGQGLTGMVVCIAVLN